MPEAGRERPASTRVGAPAYDRLEGRLDLDALDAPVDLDVLAGGADAPLLAERVAEVLERLGVTPFVRRHRALLAVAAVAAAGLLGLLGAWWSSRPEPLPEAPHVLVTASGSDRSQIGLSPAAGGLVRVRLDVAVVSSERAGVAVTLVGLTGPALEPPPDEGTALGGAAADGTAATVAATIDCASASTTSAALRAEGPEFRVAVRRTAPGGEVRVDDVGLVGAQALARVVRQTCLQQAADAELTATSLVATPLGGVPAADLELTVRDTGARVWPGLRVSTSEQPWVVNDGSSTDLAPRSTVILRARLWPRDCAAPSAELVDGLQLRASFAADDRVPYAADDAGNTFRLPLDRSARQRVDEALAAVCSLAAPTATVTRADIDTGGSADSAGTLGLTLVVRSPGAGVLQVDGDGPTAVGQLSSTGGPVRLKHGTGVLHTEWALPRCVDLLDAGGAPRFGVSLVPETGGEPRPYLLALSGDELRLALVRVCGEDARRLLE